MSGSSTIKRFAPFALIAAIVTTVMAINIMGSLVLSFVVHHSGNRIAMLYGGKAKGEIFVFGNSVADAMVTAPALSKQTGRPAYMAAIHGLDAQTQGVIIKDYVRKNPAPRIAIMEVRSAADRETMAGEIAMFSNDSKNMRRLVETEDDTVLPWRRAFPLYNFNSRNLPSVLARVLLGDDQDESGSNGNINDAKKARFVERRSVVRVDADNLRAFVESVRLLKSKGTCVVVVAAPMHPVTKKLGNWADEYAATVKQALPSDTVFLNELAAMPKDEFFEDPIHMNDAGRAAFMPILAEAISQLPATCSDGAARPD